MVRRHLRRHAAGLLAARSTSPFQLDDYAYIVGNRVLADPTVEGVVHFGRSRVLAFATLLLNYRFGGEDPFGYHVVNFAIHLLATLAVYTLALTLCRTPRLRDTRLATHALPLAVAAAFVFACHPIQIQGGHLYRAAHVLDGGAVLCRIRSALRAGAQCAARSRARTAGARVRRLRAAAARRVPLQGEQRQPAAGDPS